MTRNVRLGMGKRLSQLQKYVVLALYSFSWRWIISSLFGCQLNDIKLLGVIKYPCKSLRLAGAFLIRINMRYFLMMPFAMRTSCTLAALFLRSSTSFSDMWSAMRRSTPFLPMTLGSDSATSVRPYSP